MLQIYKKIEDMGTVLKSFVATQKKLDGQKAAQSGEKSQRSNFELKAMKYNQRTGKN